MRVELCPQISNLYTMKMKENLDDKALTTHSGNDKFQVDTHRAIIDKFSSKLDKRTNAYSVVVEHTLFLTRLRVESTNEESVNRFIGV